MHAPETAGEIVPVERNLQEAAVVLQVIHGPPTIYAVVYRMRSMAR